MSCENFMKDAFPSPKRTVVMDVELTKSMARGFISKFSSLYMARASQARMMDKSIQDRERSI